MFQTGDNYQTPKENLDKNIPSTPPKSEISSDSYELLTPWHIDFNAAEPKPKRKRKTKRIKHYCCFNKCKNNSATDDVTLHGLKKVVGDLPANATKNKAIIHERTRSHRQMQLRRCGLGINCQLPDLRICSKHKTEKNRKEIKILFDGKMVTETYELTLPKSFGVKISNIPIRHGGLGRDRSNIRVLKEVKERINSSNEFQGDAASWTLTCQQLSEENDILQKKRGAHESIKRKQKRKRKYYP